MIANLVHQGIVQIALGVLNNFGGLSDLQTGSQVGAGLDNCPLEGIHPGRRFWRAAAVHLDDRGEFVFGVARIDALRAVAATESGSRFRDDEAQAALALEDWHAHFLSGPRIHRAFLDHQGRGAGALGGTRIERLAHRDADNLKRRPVWTLGTVNRSRHHHHEYSGFRQLRRIVRELQQLGCLQRLSAGFVGAIDPLAQLLQPLAADVEADHPALKRRTCAWTGLGLDEFHRQR